MSPKFTFTKMNWFLLTVVSAIFVANIANAVQDKAFKERAEIYSSEFIFCKILIFMISRSAHCEVAHMNFIEDCAENP